MLRKKYIVIALTVVSVLVGSLFYNTIIQAQTQPEYDPIADVNRDGIVDIVDIVRVAIHFGSTLILPTQSNQTLVYVYQVETDPAQVENACVAIAKLPLSFSSGVVQVGYTNSSGLINFTLSPNTDYAAIAWSNKTYNYASFTTNYLGEASVAIQLGYPHLPPGWMVTTVINATSGAFIQDPLDIIYLKLVYNSNTGQWDPTYTAIGRPSLGVLVCDTHWGINETGHWVAMAYAPGEVLAEAGFTPDENGTAFVDIYIP